MNSLAAFALSELGLLLLGVTRLTGVVIAAPLGWHRAPARIRAVLVISVALSSHGVHPHSLDLESAGPLDWLLWVGGEFLFGAAIGLVIRFILAIAEVAAESFAPIMGLGAAQIFDPSSSSTGTVLSRVLFYLAVLIALLLGVHRTVLSAIISSFRVLPLGTVQNPGGAAEPLLLLSSAAIQTGVRIAVPILALLFITQVALAFISRAAPAMQIFSVGFAVTLAVGGVAIILTVPDMARELVAQLSYVGRQIEELAYSMQGTR